MNYSIRYPRRVISPIHAGTSRTWPSFQNASFNSNRSMRSSVDSMFLVHMKLTPSRNYREAFPTPDESRRLKALLDHLYNEGCIIISTGTCTFSTPMPEAEIDTLVEAFKSGFAKLGSVG
jgi:glutamate-1-semialdehyde aminotransferase